MNKHELSIILASFKYNNISETKAINKIFELFNRCVSCGDSDPIKPGVPWGKFECDVCRHKTGRCRICGVNRNDCCC